MSRENVSNADEALASAFRRLPVAVVIVDSARLLRPYNGLALELFAEEGLSSGLLSLRPSHPLSILLHSYLTSAEGVALPNSAVQFPSGVTYSVSPSRRSDKGGDRWLVLLMHRSGEPDSGLPDLKRWNFTSKEEEVVAALLSGASTGEIAAQLSIAENTVKSHLKKIFEKTGARSRTELLARVLRRS